MLFGLPTPRRANGSPPRLAIERPCTDFLPPPAHVRGDPIRIELLSQSFTFEEPVDWESKASGPLFTYHLHQQEYLRLASFSTHDRRERILDWIRAHRAGIGWDPHPVSLRLLCWGKLFLTPAALPEETEFRDEMLRGLADQAATLVDGLEVRLQANHLLSNLVAIVWAGMLVDGSESLVWRQHADRLLDQLDLQIHPDGGHEERSPMYHSLLLENLLDLLNLCLSAPERPPAGLVVALQATASRMLDALAVWTHADGQIALFADSGVGIASAPGDLLEYAHRLGVEPAVPPDEGVVAKSGAVLPQTGYVRLTSGAFDLIASVAAPAPAHQPGHAHCDALSFELSVHGQRLISDTGTYEYQPGERRDSARSTASHSTIQIGAAEQAEAWAAHRIGGRPVVRLEAWEEGGAAEATCRGWSKNAPLHRRLFRVRAADTEIVDRLEGRAGPVCSRLFFSVGWELDLLGDHALARCPESAATPPLSVRVDLPGALEWSLETRPCYPTFGQEENRAVLVGRGFGSVDSVIRFSIARGDSPGRIDRPAG